MSRYPLVPLGDVLILDRDELAVEATATYRMAGMYSFGRGLFEREPVTGADISYRSLFRLRTGLLVMSRLNAWEGAVTVAGDEHENCFVSNEYPTFSIATDKASPSYLAHICRWPSLWTALRDRARGMGSNVGARRLRVHPDQLLEVTIPLPDLDEQVRIAGRLSDLFTAADAVVTRHRRRRSFADALVEAVITQTFHSLSAPLYRLGEDIEIVSGATPDTGNPLYWDGDIPWVTPTDLGSLVGRDLHGSARMLSKTGFETCSAPLVPPGTVVMSSRAPIGHLGIAQVALCTNQGCKSFVPPDDVRSEYLYWAVRAALPEIRQAGSGTTFHEVSATKLRAITVPVPDRFTQDSIVRRLDHTAARVDMLDQAIHSQESMLGALQRSALNHAFAGLM